MCVVYDVLTGAVVSRLSGHDACVRDISWHPYEDSIISSSVSVVNSNCSESICGCVPIPIMQYCFIGQRWQKYATICSILNAACQK